MKVLVKNENGILTIEKVMIQGENEDEASAVEKNDQGVYDASSHVIFENKYEKTIVQPVSLNIEGNKVLENKHLQGEEFGFILTGTDDESPIRVQQQGSQDYVQVPSLLVKNDENGNIQFPSMYYLAGDAGKIFEYEIKEQVPAGVTADDPVKDGVAYDLTVKRLTVSVEEMKGELVVSAELDGEEYPLAGNEKLLTFTNIYGAQGSFHLTARKLVEGAPLIDQKFQFSVTKYKKQNDNTWTEAEFKEKTGTQINTGAVSKTVENKDSDIDFGYDYFELSDVGEYRYIIEEMDTFLGGYTKDPSRYAVYVKVSDKGSGILETSGQEIYKIDFQGNHLGEKLEQAEFVNTYKASGTQTELTVQKNLIGKDLKKGQFTFKLEAAENIDWTAADFEVSNLGFSEVPGSTAIENDSNGLVTFAPISYEQEGMHVYRITENIPAEANESNGYKVNGYTYSTRSVYVYVEVRDNGDGTLKAEKFSSPAKDPYNGVITNTFEAEGEVVLNGTKNLAGHMLEEGQFEFTMEMAKADNDTPPSEEDYKLVDKVTNKADGKFTFTAQKFAIGGKDNSNDTGVYYYRIRESVPDIIPEGYTYLVDGIKEHIVKVTVEEDSEGKLKITKTTEDGTDISADGVVFNNAYEAKGQWKPEAKKVLQGSTLTDGQFEFELLENGIVKQTVSNKADGTISFEEITFTQDDMYNQKERELVYYVREKVPSEAQAGIIYDRTLYKIYIHLTDKENGVIKVKERIVTNVNDSEEPADEMIFTNSFSGSASLIKTSEDRETPLSNAVFELYAANGEGGYDLQGSYSTNQEGRISVSGLAANQYYFVETQAPDEYLIQKDSEGNPVKYSFTIGVDSGAGMVKDAVVHYENTIVNGKGLGTAALTKYDGNDQQTLLPGVQFSLYTGQGSLITIKEESQGSYVYSGSTDGSLSVMTTGSDGRITVAGLPWGSYYFQEVQALDGYVLTDVRIPFVVTQESFDSNGSPIVMEVSAVNQKTAITIEKVDESGAGLAGAALEIRDRQTDEIVESWISDGKPHVIQGKLVVGKSYYLTEQSAPSDYELAPDQEFTVPEDGRILVTMIDRKKSSVYGNLMVTKKVSMVTSDMKVVDAVVKDYTIYVGLFTDAQGQNPYGPDYVKALHIENGSSGSVSYSNLTSGIYYVFETDAQGRIIPFNELQTDSYGSFLCTVDGSGSVRIDTQGSEVSGTVALNNIYYDFPDGFYRNATIDITKKVVKNGESLTVDDTFYAGIFTLDSDGSYQLLEDTVYELVQNGTITVTVPLGGEDGQGEITYYVMETDKEGNPVSTDKEFKYQVSGEGQVTFDKDNTQASFTITNELTEEESKTGSVTITKKVSMASMEDGIVDAFVKDYTIYVGLFTDEEGQHPYDTDYVKAVHIENGSSGSVSYTNLPSGTYYVFETDAKGNRIPFDELQMDSYGSFVCIVDGSGSVQIDTSGTQTDGTVELNNIYYDFPDGFSRNAVIDISKKVLKNGESFTADDTFYAGIFLLDSDGTYELMDNMLYELTQNGTISVEVPLGGDDGEGQVTYYVMETDAEGNPVSTDEGFQYKVSGEGEVTLDVDHTNVALTITNEAVEQNITTPTPTPTPTPTLTPTPPSTLTPMPTVPPGTDNKGTVKDAVKTGDNTNIWPYLLLLAAAAGVVVILGYRRRRREN